MLSFFLLVSSITALTRPGMIRLRREGDPRPALGAESLEPMSAEAVLVVAAIIPAKALPTSDRTAPIMSRANRVYEGAS